MRRVVISVVVGFITAYFIGIALQYCIIDGSVHPHVANPITTPVIWIAVVYSVVLNFLFFYIRRWGGCIEKLGGFTFTVLLGVASLTPILIGGRLLSEPSNSLFEQLGAIMAFQVVVVGLLATHFLRTKNFDPPKPGEPLKW